MTALRHAHQTRHTIGPDRRDVRLPCESYPAVYTDLIDNMRPDPENVEAAKMMCATCVLNQPEVADKCLRGAIDNRERWAIHVLDRRPETTIGELCGTRTGSERHYRAGETPCPDCKVAGAEYRAEWKRRQKEKAA